MEYFREHLDIGVKQLTKAGCWEAKTAADKFGSLGPSRLATRSLDNFWRSASQSASASDRNVSNCAVVVSSSLTAGILRLMHQSTQNKNGQCAPLGHQTVVPAARCRQR